jgi:hypothetical protein
MATRAADDFRLIAHRRFTLARPLQRLDLCRRARGESAVGCGCTNPAGDGVDPCPPGWEERFAKWQARHPAPAAP